MSASSSEQFPADSVELQRGDMSARISLKGAWLERLDYNGEPVLFPKQTIEAADGSLKVRGGSHVCLPNFGPGGNTELAQHGFGRKSQWSVKEQSADGVTLSLDELPTDYEGLFAELRYMLTDDGIAMSLRAKNLGQQALRISPGFHPYFAAGGAEAVQVDGKSFAFADIAEAIVLPAEPSHLLVANHEFDVSANLTQWVLWTDSVGDYVCLEPTQAGASFKREPTADEMLPNGQEREWALQISYKTGGAS